MFQTSDIPESSSLDRNGNEGTGLDKDKQLLDDSNKSIHEVEKGYAPSPNHNSESKEFKSRRSAGSYSRLRNIVHVAILAVITGWWIASLILHRKDKNWIIPFIFWFCVALRILFFYIPIAVITYPIHLIWLHTGVSVYQVIPVKFRTVVAGIITFVGMLLGALLSEEVGDNNRVNRMVSLLGLVVIIALLWMTSTNRKAIN